MESAFTGNKKSCTEQPKDFLQSENHIDIIPQTGENFNEKYHEKN